ncbi:reverse transcriptase domain-containing protein, partial [Tanacetum coccineum]
MMRQIQTIKSVDTKCETCGGPHSFTECPAADGYTQEAAYAITGNHNLGGNAYQPQGDRNLLSYRSNNYLGPPGFNQPNVQNNQNRYNQNQNQNQGNFQAPNYQAPNNQGRGQNFNQGNNNYQALNFQAPNYQAQVGPSNELTNYIKSNEATLRAMQTHMTNMKTELRNEFKSTIDARTNKIENQNNQIMNILTNMQNQNSSGSGSLPSNTVANPRGDVKAITTRSGVAYDGPSIPPTPSPLLKEVECETKATKDKVQNSKELDECLALADLGASINLMPLSIRKKPSLPELTPTRMILELADRSTTSPSGITKDAFEKVGKFHFPSDFVVVDPWVPLILGRPFLRMARALIDVYGEELTLRVDDEAITFKVGQTSRYSYNDAESVNRIDVIDVSCEEHAQEVLRFSDSFTSGNPTPSLDPIISTSFPFLTPFEGGDFILEEIKACLTNDSIPPGIDDADFDPEGDLLLLEKLLNDHP